MGASAVESHVLSSSPTYSSAPKMSTLCNATHNLGMLIVTTQDQADVMVALWPSQTACNSSAHSLHLQNVGSPHLKVKSDPGGPTHILRLYSQLLPEGAVLKIVAH